MKVTTKHRPEVSFTTFAINNHYFRPWVHRPSADYCTLCGMSAAGGRHAMVGQAKLRRSIND